MWALYKSTAQEIKLPQNVLSWSQHCQQWGMYSSTFSKCSNRTIDFRRNEIILDKPFWTLLLHLATVSWTDFPSTRSSFRDKSRWKWKTPSPFCLTHSSLKIQPKYHLHESMGCQGQGDPRDLPVCPSPMLPTGELSLGKDRHLAQVYPTDSRWAGSRALVPSSVHPS